MIGMFRGVGINLIDFKLEFGRIKINGKNEIILADEISPDTCRLWDSVTDKKLDKDRFRKDLGDLIPAYTEVAKRLGILHEQSNVSAVNVTKLSSVSLEISPGNPIEAGVIPILSTPTEITSRASSTD